MLNYFCDRIRGTLSSMSPLMFNTGILMGFIVGEYVSYNLIPLSGFLSLTYLILTFLFIPETPQFLLSKGESEKAFQSLLFYRTVNAQMEIPQKVKQEFSDLKKFQEAMKEDNRVSWSVLCEFTFCIYFIFFALIRFNELLSIIFVEKL